ncbi:carotenoid oxygenase family protein [Streptomyces sp. NEAU-Y11]|uniref:carotenoid oxygenase family protein n=1 Tax=Streptomyces cucumeris TaxID=2962890 RepID=UPI0020C9355E|nr:carotenoid oxygenase family protein [Streptomyces sp. NEAU-Y11]MCP9206678.1 carotenoid oxygenase family protein [Streptomyces sp. NEAU-Y11]
MSTEHPTTTTAERPTTGPAAKPYVSGHYTPVVDEVTAHGLTVHGTLPPELNGRYFRNGHNPKPGYTPTHWFKGSGMIHGVRLRDGRAEWYRNRWVRTLALDGVPYLSASGVPDLKVSEAATHVIEHAGRILALQEASLPYEMTPELDTVGAFDFGGTLKTAMTAHPKTDPATGELHFFAYGPFPPHLTYYVADAAGAIVRAETVDGAGPSLMHDFGLTRQHVVWLDLPIVFNPAEQSGIPYRWSDTYTPRIGVMPRSGPATVRWFEVEPGALLHVANAYEDERGRIVLTGPRYDRGAWEQTWKWWTGAPGYATEPMVGATAHRWILDPATGRAVEETVDDFVTEFPSINEDMTGAPHRFDYAVAFPGSGLGEYAIVKYDHTTGARELVPMGPGRMPGEAVFVPAAGATREDDGYLLTVVSDLEQDASQLLILDASALSDTPVATVELPRRVPSGIHGSWIADAGPDAAEAGV